MYGVMVNGAMLNAEWWEQFMENLLTRETIRWTTSTHNVKGDNRLSLGQQPLTTESVLKIYFF